MQNEPVSETYVVPEAPARAITLYFVLETRSIFVLQRTILKILIPSALARNFQAR